MKSLSEQSLDTGMVRNLPHSGMDTPETHTPDAQTEQAAFGEAQAFQYTSSLAQRIFAVVVNLLVLGELTIGMYFAARSPESFTPVFFKVFFGLLVPTLVGAVFIKRLINARTKK